MFFLCWIPSVIFLRLIFAVDSTASLKSNVLFYIGKFVITAPTKRMPEIASMNYQDWYSPSKIRDIYITPNEVLMVMFFLALGETLILKEIVRNHHLLKIGSQSIYPNNKTKIMLSDFSWNSF